jgi:hypothetical protein
MIYASIPMGFFPTFTTFVVLRLPTAGCECRNNIYVTIIILIRILCKLKCVSIKWFTMCSVCKALLKHCMCYDAHTESHKNELIFTFQLDKNMSVYERNNLLIWWHCKMLYDFPYLLLTPPTIASFYFRIHFYCWLLIKHRASEKFSMRATTERDKFPFSAN